MVSSTAAPHHCRKAGIIVKAFTGLFHTALRHEYRNLGVFWVQADAEDIVKPKEAGAWPDERDDDSKTKGGNVFL